MNNTYIPVTPQPPKKKGGKGWIIALSITCGVLLLLFLALSLVTCVALTSTDDPLDGFDYDYIGVLTIDGTITSGIDINALLSGGTVYNQQYVLEAIKVMKNDPENKGILLLINSPGGEMYAIDEVYRALMDYKESTKRPIYAYCEEYCASGGYYLAVTADKIYANPMSTIGSIGVTYGTHVDISGLCEKLGIKLTDIVSDDNKAMGSSSSPITADQMAIYQRMIDEYYGRFLDVVDAGRPELTREDLTRKTVIGYATNENGEREEITLKLADGRVFTANQAVTYKLIDQIGGLGNVMDDMEKLVGDSDIPFEYFQYVPDYNDFSYLYASSDAELVKMLLAYSEQMGPLVLYKN